MGGWAYIYRRLLSYSDMPTTSHVVTVTTVDYKFALEYLKLFFSWPFTTLLITLYVLSKYRETIQRLMPRLRSLEAIGTKASFDPEAVAESAVDSAIQPKRAVLEALPEGDDKVAKITALEQEAALLKNNLTQALEQQPISISSFGNIHRGDFNPANDNEMKLMQLLRKSCGDIIRKWIIDNHVETSASRRATSFTDEMMTALLRECKEKSSHVRQYNEYFIKIVLTKIILSEAPMARSVLVGKPSNDGFLPYPPIE